MDKVIQLSEKDTGIIVAKYDPSVNDIDLTKINSETLRNPTKVLNIRRHGIEILVIKNIDLNDVKYLSMLINFANTVRISLDDELYVSSVESLLKALYPEKAGIITRLAMANKKVGDIVDL